MRILTWNTRGSSAQEKVNELAGIIDFWLQDKDEEDEFERPDPVGIICLQELSVDNDLITPYLTSQGYTYQKEREGYKSTGLSQLIAVCSGYKIEYSGIIELCLDDYEKGFYVRLPQIARVNIGGNILNVITYHAPRDGYRYDMLDKLSQYIKSNLSGQMVILAGDLNVDEDDAQRIFGNNTSIYSHNWDHIISWNINITDGIHNADLISDHYPMSVRLI